MMTRIAQCAVQLGPRPGRDRILRSLSGQVGRLALRTAQCAVGANLGPFLDNFIG